jgi:hypothetical protein
MRGAGSLALLFLCLTTPVVADPRTDVLSTAARCNAIADYRVWLDCYYGAAQSMRTLLGLAPAPPAQTRLVPPAGAAQPASPVASVAPPRAALPPEAYEDYRPRQKMASYSFDGEHLFTVTLEDGSVWQQSDEDFVRARWNAPAGSYYASVTRGSFGSHLLKVSDKHSYRVKRVR